MRRIDWTSAPRGLRILVLAACVITAGCESSRTTSPAPPAATPGYLDAHNHGYSGIIPFYAYADLQAFIRDPEDPSRVSLEDRRQLWRYLVEQLATKPCPSGRISCGAIKTAEAYGQDIDSLSAQQVDGALERVLTATPWTEFDSAYAIRGDAVLSYLRVQSEKLRTLYPSASAVTSHALVNQALCDAAILQLAVSRTQFSEQFLSFIGGWGSSSSAQDKLDVIRCFAKRPQALAETGRLAKWLVPDVKVLLMTHTSELGQVDACDGNTTPNQFAVKYTTGRCECVRTLSRTPPQEITQALMGIVPGQEDRPAAERATFFDRVVGVDTAGPESTCFTGADMTPPGLGMQNYANLVTAVYDAARTRRSEHRWRGKLLVHTHVGEGGPSYQWDQRVPQTAGCAAFPSGPRPREIFAAFPPVPVDPVTGRFVHVQQASSNVKTLLAAVGRIKEQDPGIDDYVIFRFGHVTHADLADATAMKRLRIEADINLESNIATRAFLTPELACAGPAPLTEPEQFRSNNLPGRVLASGRAVQILSDHSLKYMLQAGVRTLLGSDGGGTEHSDIGRAYALAGQLIEYWKSQGVSFPPDTNAEIFHRHAAAHLADMKDDRRRP